MQKHTGMQDGRRELVKSLFYLAWADGEVCDEEVQVLSRLMELMGFGLSERLAIMDAHLDDAPEELGNLESVLPDHQSRLQAMQALIMVCYSDRQLAQQEMEGLHLLATRLGIGAEDLNRLRHQALKELGQA